MSENKGNLVQCFGRKKNAVAVATVKAGQGVMRVNGSPVDLIEPRALRTKVMEPVLLLGLKHFTKLDVRVRVRGGGYVAQVYAIRQAISKGIVAYYQKFVNETEKRQLKCKFFDIQNYFYNMTELFSLLIPVDVSLKNMEVQVPVLDAKSLTDDSEYSY